MALSGKGAMVLFYDIVPEAVEEHDDWHTHEHFEERVSIPGFLRATRWVNLEGAPRYLALYEVEEVRVLSDAPYLERLNNPTPWTQKVMPSFRGMTRGFCSVTLSAGLGLGQALVAIRFSPAPGKEAGLRAWLGEILPALCRKKGLTSAHLFEPAARPPMTKEQQIRGKDADMQWVLLVTGYGAQAVDRVAQEELAQVNFQAQGAASNSTRARYRFDNLLTKREC
jgi:hypothetical protein